MTARVAGVTLAALALMSAYASAAVSPLLSSARLQGTFALSGRVTVAVHVKGEHPGQRVFRTWTFQPLCPSGQCASIRVTRTRPGGTDSLTLHLTSPAHYTGGARFYAPLNCAGQLNARGESVPFVISVRITAATASSSGVVATRVAASYRNRRRTNLTQCVTLPSHDAAIYAGTLRSSGAARQISDRSPGGS